MGDLASSTTFQVPPELCLSLCVASPPSPALLKSCGTSPLPELILFVGGFVMSFVFVAKAVRGPSPSTYNTYQLGRLRTS